MVDSQFCYQMVKLRHSQWFITWLIEITFAVIQTADTSDAILTVASFFDEFLPRDCIWLTSSSLSHTVYIIRTTPKIQSTTFGSIKISGTKNWSDLGPEVRRKSHQRLFWSKTQLFRLRNSDSESTVVQKSQ